MTSGCVSQQFTCAQHHPCPCVASLGSADATADMLREAFNLRQARGSVGAAARAAKSGGGGKAAGPVQPKGPPPAAIYLERRGINKPPAPVRGLATWGQIEQAEPADQVSEPRIVPPKAVTHHNKRV